jgi:hypothetical protein
MDTTIIRQSASIATVFIFTLILLLISFDAEYTMGLRALYLFSNPHYLSSVLRGAIRGLYCF